MSNANNTAANLCNPKLQALRAALKGRIREDGVCLRVTFRNVHYAETYVEAVKALGGDVWSVEEVGTFGLVKMTFSVGTVEDLYLAGRETLAGARELAEDEEDDSDLVLTAPKVATATQWRAFALRAVHRSCETLCTVKVSVRGDDALQNLQKALEGIDPGADRHDNGKFGLLYEGMDDDDDTWAVLVRNEAA